MKIFDIFVKFINHNTITAKLSFIRTFISILRLILDFYSHKQLEWKMLKFGWILQWFESEYFVWRRPDRRTGWQDAVLSDTCCDSNYCFPGYNGSFHTYFPQWFIRIWELIRWLPCFSSGRTLLPRLSRCEHWASLSTLSKTGIGFKINKGSMERQTSCLFQSVNSYGWVTLFEFPNVIIFYYSYVICLV